MTDSADTRVEPRRHSLRLELVDEPGELASVLEPIAEHGGNLLSIYHEREDRTPRGHIPVEMDLSCPPDAFDTIVSALRDGGVTVVRADERRFGETTTVLLTGHLADTDLSDTLRCIEAEAEAAVEDLTLATDRGVDGPACARLRLGTPPGERDAVVAAVGRVAARKGLTVVEPLEATP